MLVRWAYEEMKMAEAAYAPGEEDTMVNEDGRRDSTEAVTEKGAVGELRRGIEMGSPDVEVDWKD